MVSPRILLLLWVRPSYALDAVLLVRLEPHETLLLHELRHKLLGVVEACALLIRLPLYSAHLSDNMQASAGTGQVIRGLMSKICLGFAGRHDGDEARMSEWIPPDGHPLAPRCFRATSSARGV